MRALTDNIFLGNLPVLGGEITAELIRMPLRIDLAVLSLSGNANHRPRVPVHTTLLRYPR